MKILTITALLLALQGCATAYQSQGFSGGYSETQLDENVFTVTFNGNGYTRGERATDFTLLRSAELTLERGYKYFVIVNSYGDTQQSTFQTPTNSYTTGTINSYGNTSTLNATTNTYGGQTFLISKPSRSNTIVCYEDKPEGAFSYSARFVYDRFDSEIPNKHTGRVSL